jgi:predicted MFS family arabinose efflux permease
MRIQVDAKGDGDVEDTLNCTDLAPTEDQTGERPEEQAGDRIGARPGGRAAAEAGDRSGARPGGQAVAEAGAVRTLPLWWNSRFQTLWIGTTASTVGVSVADIAYPLTILAITRSPAWAGLFAAVQAIGMLIAGLPSGMLADRYDTRKIVIVTEAARAAVTGMVVVALISGWLSLPVLLGAAVLLGIGQAIKGSAQILLLRSVVPPGQLTQALTQDEVRINGAALAGPALGGALYGIRALAHAVPFLLTAVSFLVALITAVMMKFMPGTAPDPADQSAEGTSAAPSGKASGNMLAGLRTLWNQPVLRAATLLIMFVNTIGAGLELVIIVILRHQAVPSGTIGLALGLGAAGGLAGAPLVKILHRLRPGVLMLSLCLLDVTVLALLAVPFGPWWVAGLMFTIMLGVPALRVLVDILVIRQAPAEQRGRVVAALITLISLGIPAGVAGCGLLLQYLPAQTAMLTLAAIEAAGVAYGSTRRELWQARWPAESPA